MFAKHPEDSSFSKIPLLGSYFINTFHFIFSISLISAFLLNFGRAIDFSLQFATISFTLGGLIYGLIGSSEIKDEQDKRLSSHLL